MIRARLSRVAAGVLIAVVLTVVEGCVGPAAPREPLPAPQAAASIYIVSHGWHAGIVLNPTDPLQQLGLKQRLLLGAKYLEFGWGDAGYYPNPDPGLGALLKAGLWPTKSVVHVVAFDIPVTKFFPGSEVIRLELSAKEMAALNRFIYKSFRLEPHGPVVVKAGLYGESAFYQSRLKYHLFHNCNHWVARAMKAAGLPTRPAFALTKRQLLAQLRPLGQVIQPSKK